MHANVDPEKGCLLVAEPFLGDPSFERAVIFLTAHNAVDGSVGFVLNQPLDGTTFQLFKDLENLDFGLSHGGPVEQDGLFFIHQHGDLIPNSQPILDDLWWGGDIEVIKELIQDGKITSDTIRFFLGYSGWSTGQLQMELDAHSWVVFQGKPEHVFSSSKNLWRDQIMKIGGNYKLWANSPSDPILN